VSHLINGAANGTDRSAELPELLFLFHTRQREVQDFSRSTPSCHLLGPCRNLW